MTTVLNPSIFEYADRRITFQYMTLPPDYFTSRSQRDPISGRVSVSIDAEGDFRLIDLFARERGLELKRDFVAVARDPYIYEPVLLPWRTWVYSSVMRCLYADRFKGRKNVKNKKLRAAYFFEQCSEILGNESVDGVGSILGFFSPVLFSCLCFIFTRLFDESAFNISIIYTRVFPVLIFLLSLFLAFYFNTYRSYFLGRFITLPLRIVLAVQFAFELARYGGISGILGTLAGVYNFVFLCLSLAVLAVDLILGDLVYICGCLFFFNRFQIYTEITSKYMLASIQGHVGGVGGFTYPIEATGSGGLSCSRQALLVNIQDGIFLLRPLEGERLAAICDSVRAGRPIPILSLGVFNETNRNGDLLIKERTVRGVERAETALTFDSSKFN